MKLTEYHKLVLEWCDEKNVHLKINELASGSDKKAWWRCDNNKLHVWEASIKSRARGGTGCPYCNGKQCLPEESFAYKFPELLREWSETNITDPYAITPHSNKICTWVCSSNSDHMWNTRVAKRTLGTKCPYCSNKRISDDNSLYSKNSQAAQMWHPVKNGSLTPKKVMAGSDRYVWWRCSKNKSHEWKARVANINYGFGCPWCSNKKVAKENSLACLFPALSREIDEDVDVWKISPGSGKKVWWVCKNGHRWKTKVQCRTTGKTGCPRCKQSKGEEKISELLNKFNIRFERQKRFKKCRNKLPLPFDFYIPDLKLCIEYDGIQHYKGWGGHENNKRYIITNDNIKDSFIRKSSMTLIRIPYYLYEDCDFLLEGIIGEHLHKKERKEWEK